VRRTALVAIAEGADHARWIPPARPAIFWLMAKAPNRNRTGPRRAGAPEPARGRLPIRVSLDREALAALDRRAVAAQVGIGLAGGWLASWVVGGSGLLRYLLTGLVGSLVGGFLLERLGIDLGIRSRLANRIVAATLGAIVVVLVARLIG
jgi:uncharacterized membrane protein YeaQ/YmgE (transglycosylase-associated protein family)